MANIVGEGFNEKIFGQINQRQSQYGSISRDNQTLNYLNNTNGWVRLVSSVDVDTEVSTLRGIDLSGVELAKAYVLSGGVAPLKGGIARDKSITNTNVYGLGGTEFGLRPMPGITKASIKTETRGALKTATVNLKANNKTQFDIIELLYMRLGYSILLEWGNTSYFDNEGNYISDNLASLETEFLNASIGYEDIYSKIAEKRDDTCGNYDAIFAKVVNFSWSFQADGTYNITLTLRSMGDVIESLKSDILIQGTVSINSNNDEEEEDNSPSEDEDAYKIIFYYKDSHSIGKFFFENYTKLIKSSESGKSGVTYLKTKNIKGGGESVNFISQDYRNFGYNDRIFYVRLGYFLEWLETNIVPKVKSNKIASLINIDTNVSTNIIHLQRYQLSADPRVCLFKSTWKTSDGERYKFIPEAETFVVTKNDNRYGKIMNAYFSMDYILQLLKNIQPTPDDSGGVGLYDLIDEICKGWNTTTGDFNSLEPNADAETNTLKLIDSTSLPDRDEWLKEFGISTTSPLFDVYGYYNRDEGSGAGFITKFDFTTTIANNLASMVTVGATSNGNMVGEDATALSRMNKGLTDRIKPKISHDLSKEEQEDARAAAEKEYTEAAKKKTQLEEDYKEALSNFTEFVKKLALHEYRGKDKKGRFSKDTIDTYSKTLNSLIKYDQSKLTEKAKKENLETQPASPNSGFLPFDLTLEMKGLSGMKVYQKFFVDTDYLPSNYPSSLEFLIKSITHEIGGNQWSTTIESMAIPKNPFGSGASKELPNRKKNSKGNGQRKNVDEDRGNPSTFTDQTITSGFPLNPKGYGKRTFDKTQIILHYSAGWQKTDNGKSTIDVLNIRGLSYHYIIDAAGNIEQLLPDNAWAYNAGKANRYSIGISLQNIGYGPSATESSYGPIPDSQFTKNVELVNYEGNKAPYRNKSWNQEVTNAQIEALKKLYLQIKANNPSIPSYKWEGQQTYDILFPPNDKDGNFTTSWNNSVPGIYTHCSITTGKRDAMPTPKIVQFFKDLVL